MAEGARDSARGLVASRGKAKRARVTISMRYLIMPDDAWVGARNSVRRRELGKARRCPCRRYRDVRIICAWSGA